MRQKQQSPTFRAAPEVAPTDTKPVSDQVAASAVKEPSEKEKLAAEKRYLREMEIDAALARFCAEPDPAKRARMLAAQEAVRVENVAWSRFFDSKVSPILAVAGFALAGFLTLLKDVVLLHETPVAAGMLIAAALCLVYAVLRSVITISPTLKVAEPVYRLFGFIHLFSERHVAHDPADEQPGILYFGHFAKHDAAGAIRAAVHYYADEPLVFRDTVTQNLNNAKVCTERCVDIAMAARAVILAVVFALIAAFCFLCRW